MASQKIVELWRKTGPNVFSLVVQDNKGSGLVVFQATDSAIEIRSCLTYNSPIHCLTAFPANVLYSKTYDAWYSVKTVSHQNLRAYSYREQLNAKVLRVITEFTWPEKYEGLRYKTRRLYFKREGTKMFLLRVVTDYDDDRRDTGDFRYYQRNHSSRLGSSVEITWKCQVEPAKSNEIFLLQPS